MAIPFIFIGLSFVLVVVAGIYGGVTAHKAVHGTWSSSEVPRHLVGVAALVVAASALALTTTAVTKFLTEIG